MKKTRRSAEKSIQVKIWTEIIGGGTGEIISYNFYAEFIFQASTKPLRQKFFILFSWVFRNLFYFYVEEVRGNIKVREIDKKSHVKSVNNFSFDFMISEEKLRRYDATFMIRNLKQRRWIFNKYEIWLRREVRNESFIFRVWWKSTR